MKLTESFSRTNQIYAKAITVCESTYEINPMSAWTLFELLRSQQLLPNKDFSTKTRLYNIFKTKNTKTFIKVIVEGLYKVIQMTWKTTTVRQAIHMSHAVQFLATFYV